MALKDFRTVNYRSVRDVWLMLKKINVIVGPNGCGKSNLYRAMYLLASTATGQLARSVAEEGGVASLIWAGGKSKKEAKEKKKIQDVLLSVKTDSFRYDLKFGTFGDWNQPLRPEIFAKDLEIKREKVSWLASRGRKILLDRRKGSVSAWDIDGRKLEYTQTIQQNESVLSVLRDPHRFKELSALRQELLDWRFYHQFRTDADSPLRQPQFCVHTPIMSHDGSDLVPALASIMNDIKNPQGVRLEQCVDQAFPGARINVIEKNGLLRLQMSSPGISRPLELKELSDGTLQYFCLLAALLSPIPPSVLVLNEPETSIHPNLLEPLARLIVDASKNSQMWITTHSQDLSDYILDMSGYEPLELKKVDGETKLVGVGLGGYTEDEDDDLDEDEEA